MVHHLLAVDVGVLVWIRAVRWHVATLANTSSSVPQVDPVEGDALAGGGTRVSIRGSSARTAFAEADLTPIGPSRTGLARRVLELSAQRLVGTRRAGHLLWSSSRTIVSRWTSVALILVEKGSSTSS